MTALCLVFSCICSICSIFSALAYFARPAHHPRSACYGGSEELARLVGRCALGAACWLVLAGVFARCG